MAVLGMNQGTSAYINFDLVGTVNTQVVGVGYGTISTIGTLPNLPGGSIVVTSIPNVPAGTITRVSTLGTMEVGTISSLPNLPQGSIQVTAGTITAGSIRVTLGTVVGPVASAAAASGGPLQVGGTDAGGSMYAFLTDTAGHMKADILSGSIVVIAGTIAAHAITAATVTAGTINTGTINSGTINTGTINTGTFVMTVGTVTVLPNLPQGSIQVTAGTITHGTIDIGTLRDDGRAARNILTYGTQVTGTAAVAATIIGSASVGAGTSLWVQDISIVNSNANVLCVLGFGTAQQGTNVLFRGTLGTTSAVGIEKAYNKTVNAGMTNQDLIFSLGGAGTVDLSFSYFISA